MTIYYVDLVSGDDSAGDGSLGNPWKTIDKGTLSRSAGDEIRVKKSTMATLSGTLTFTNGSTSVSTSADLTGEVAVGDLIGKNSGNEGWWIVASRTSSVITLTHQYYTDSGSGDAATGYKMTPIALSATQWIKSGGSAGNALTISGGWDFTGPTRNGLTPMAYSSYAGMLGLYYQNMNYLDISWFIFCIPTAGSYCAFTTNSRTTGSYFHNLYFAAAGTSDAQFILNTAYKNRIEKIFVTGGSAGIKLTTAIMNSFKDIYTYSPGSSLYSSHSGIIYQISVYLNSWDNLNCFNSYDANITYLSGCWETFKNSKLDKTRGSGAPGIYFGSTAVENIWYGGSIINSAGAAISCNNAAHCNQIVGDVVLSGNASDYSMPTYTSPPGNILLLLKKSGGDLIAIGLGYTGTQKITHTATGARSGNCLKIEIPDIDYPKSTRIGSTKIISTASDIVVGAYIKKDGSFNGSVYFYATVDGKQVVAKTEKTPTESYAQQTVTVSSADLVSGKYIELYIIVWGSAGALYVDDFSVV